MPQDPLYEEVVRLSPDAIVVHRNEKVLFANPAALKLFGAADEGELRSCNATNLVHPDDLARARRRLKDLDSGTKTVLFTKERLRRLDGTAVVVNISTTRVTIDGEPAYLSIARDLTEPKRKHRALAKSQNLVDAIAETVLDSIFCKDLQCRYTFVNPAMQKLLGKPAEEILGKTPVELFGREAAKVIAEVDEPVTRGESVDAIRSLELGGRTFTFHTVQVPLRDLEGAVAGICGIVRDITETQQLEQRLRQSEKMEAVGQLAGGIAHDFNNQLAAVSGFAELLGVQLEDSDQTKYVEGILHACKHATSLTQQLLAVARRSAAQQQYVDLHGLLKELAEMLRRTLDRKIQVIHEPRNDGTGTIGDPAQLQNMFLNLALNARDAMPSGGKLAISAAIKTLAEPLTLQPQPLEPGRYVVVSVGDTGTGMTADVQSRIFEPFFTTKPPNEGTGLGLAAVYGTVKAHGGAIQVESEVDVGTQFHVWLPYADAEKPDEQPPGTAPTLPGRPHVLLVDDEDVVRYMAMEMLRKLGCEVTVACNGRDAVDLFKEHGDDLDLVLLDVVMPIMGGRETFAALRTLDPDVRVVVASGFGLSDDAHSILDIGAAGFVQKPYKMQHLAQVLKDALDNDQA